MNELKFIKIMYEFRSPINKHKLIIMHFLFTFLNRELMLITNILKTIKENIYLIRFEILFMIKKFEKTLKIKTLYIFISYSVYIYIYIKFFELYYLT